MSQKYRSASEGPKKGEKSSDATPMSPNDELKRDKRLMSIYTRAYAKGPNACLSKGPKDDLLL
jgi:hypothetical protein